MSKLIVANWKSNKTLSEAQRWTDVFKQQYLPSEDQVVIFPSFPQLTLVSAQLTSLTNVSVGAQTISPFPAGSYTGAVSTRNLEGLPVKYAIVGHYEQRHFFGFSSHVVAMQVEQCLSANITPIVCVDMNTLADQANRLAADQLSKCVVAFEPIEAIGSGENAPVSEVTEAVARIKTVFGDVRVLYGGSVSASNIGEYTAICNGALVATASLEVESFLALLNAARS